MSHELGEIMRANSKALEKLKLPEQLFVDVPGNRLKRKALKK
jgi:hypothetical protein